MSQTPDPPPARPAYRGAALGTAVPAPASPPPVPQSDSTYLVAIAGPPRPPLALDPAAGGAGDGLILGRHDDCDLCLNGAEQVSRRHARLSHRAADAEVARPVLWRGTPQPRTGGRGGWSVADAGSRWGTFLNGQRLAAGQELPLRPGDQLRVTPWTFLVSATPVPHGVRLASDDDAAAEVLATPLDAAGPLRQERLALLLSGAAALQDAGDEVELARRLMRLVRDGTGLANAAVLRPLDAGGERGGRFEVVASTAPAGGDGEAAGFAFSRSLLEAARSGRVAEVRAEDTAIADAAGQSIVRMRIERAICVPILLGETPALYLYLDRRGEPPASVNPAVTMAGPAGSGSTVPAAAEEEPAADEAHAVPFCAALSKIASLALSHLKRLDLQRRAAQLDADLAAAAAAQQWILPGRHTEAAGFRITGESRPGRGVGGDFFDLLDLGDGRLAVALGDVSGKGVAAGVLMTATQGYLNALLGGGESPAAAARRLTRFVHPRRPSNRFVTLWVGLFDRAAGKLTYVDAGHGLAILSRASANGGQCHELTGGGGLPIGIEADGDYEETTVDFAAGDAALIVSDGIVEQPADGNTFEDRDEFGLKRTRDVLCGSMNAGDPLSDPPADPPADPVAAVFDAVVKHAGTASLADDATAVLVRW